MGVMQGAHGVLLVTLVLASACLVEEDAELDDVAWRVGREDVGGTIIVPGDDPSPGSEDGGGGRTGGDWIINGLSEPMVSGVDPAFALDSAQGLGEEGWLAEGDEDGEKVIRYLVQCALDESQSVTVEGALGAYLFEGQVGLAPEWRTGPCDESCQRWVSACMLARTNETGAEVTLFVQGAHPSLGFGSDPAFPLYEGTYFGNVFVDPAAMFACRGQTAGTAAAVACGRTCSQSDEDCGFTTYGDCVVEAGCGLASTGVATIDCQPDPQGPAYPGISVHLSTP
jgi:hypothetical protein